MKRLICNPQFGFIRPRVAIAVALGLVIIPWLAIRWQPERVIRRQQATFVEALEKRSQKKMLRVLAEDYRDQWDFDRNDAVVTLLDVGSQFFVLGVMPLDPAYEVGDGRASSRMRFEVTGTGSPIAQEVMRRANRLKEPFVFTWEKESFWPNSWRITRIEHAELPEELYGYQPGDITNATGAAGF